MVEAAPSAPARAASRPPPEVYGVCRTLAADGFVLLPGPRFAALLCADGFPAGVAEAFADSWNDLEIDAYMADRGTYRRRRHAVFAAGPNGAPAHREPDQPHYQARIHNPLHGGIARHFAPILPSTVANPAMRRVLDLASRIFGTLSPSMAWHIEAHQFRITAAAGGGKPTPEGMHRDGVDYALMLMIHRRNVIGGETEIQDPHGNRLAAFTLAERFECALVDDQRVRHGVTPILRRDPSTPGHRDVLVVTFRRP